MCLALARGTSGETPPFLSGFGAAFAKLGEEVVTYLSPTLLVALAIPVVVGEGVIDGLDDMAVVRDVAASEGVLLTDPGQETSSLVDELARREEGASFCPVVVFPLTSPLPDKVPDGGLVIVEGIVVAWPEVFGNDLCDDRVHRVLVTTTDGVLIQCCASSVLNPLLVDERRRLLSSCAHLVAPCQKTGVCAGEATQCYFYLYYNIFLFENQGWDVWYNGEMAKLGKPLLGAHVSVAGGYENGITAGEAMGAEVIQIFGASPRQWAVKVSSETKVEAFKKQFATSSLQALYLHGAYLVNLGAANPEAWQKSVANLIAHYQIATHLGADGLIFHVGSPNGDDKQQAMDRAIKGMKEVLKKVTRSTSSGQAGKSWLIMENSASHKKLGATPEEMRYMWDGVGSDRVKVCIDTAHAFEAGLIMEYAPAKIKVFLDEWDAAVGLKEIPVLHVNDSKTAAGSNNDRHENIGEGLIGKQGFAHLAREKRMAGKHWILEVPGFDGKGPDKRNLDILKRCVY